MKEILLIKTNESKKIRNFLNKENIDYQVIYNEAVQDGELSQAEFEKKLAQDYQDWANDPEEWKDADGE